MPEEESVTVQIILRPLANALRYRLRSFPLKAVSSKSTRDSSSPASPRNLGPLPSRNGIS